MQKIHYLIFIIPLGIIASSVLPADAIVANQQDDFEDGTTQGWISGVPNPNPPANIPNGGPTGVGDNYLQITSNGQSGPGGKPVSFNISQWTGDYVSAGVIAITVDLNNFGNTPLEIRLRVSGPGGDFVSVNSASLSASSGWQTVTFQLGAADLTGGADLTSTLSSVSRLWIFHNAIASFHGPSLVATLGADNIVAGLPSNLQPVGGEMIPLDTSMVLLAGTHSVAAWMIPVIVSAIGIGIVIARKF